MIDEANVEKAIAFLNAIEEVCRKHGISISHEDLQGGFELVQFSEEKMEWLRHADYRAYTFKQME